MWQADRVEIDVVIDTHIDILQPDIHTDNHCVTQRGLVYHFDPKNTELQAENGLSLLVTVHRGNASTRILFDAGLTGKVLMHNLRAMGIDPNTIDHVVISHGHPDHFGGIYSLLRSREYSLPIATHEDAFLPRYAIMGDSRTAQFYNEAFRSEDLGEGPGRLVLNRDAMHLGLGAYTSGEIPRVIDFESPTHPTHDMSLPGLYQVNKAGNFVHDYVVDEQALYIDVKDQGLIVITGCAHAGVVNTISRAHELYGDRPVRAVLGGFHLGFPTTPKENVQSTVEALTDHKVRSIMPMHCSGLPAQAAFMHDLPANFIQPTVGMTLTFGGES